MAGGRHGGRASMVTGKHGNRSRKLADRFSIHTNRKERDREKEGGGGEGRGSARL